MKNRKYRSAGILVTKVMFHRNKYDFKNTKLEYNKLNQGFIFQHLTFIIFL